MKIRHLSVDQTMARLERARKECPGSLYERHLEAHLRRLQRAWRSTKAAK